MKQAAPPRQIVTLTEYSTITLAPDHLAAEEAARIWRGYTTQLRLEAPSLKTQQHWQLTAQGWVGFIALSANLGIALQPKVALGNLLRIIEIAYALDQLDVRPGQWPVTTLVDFYSQLARLLAQRVLALRRQGIYHAYSPQTSALPYLRGRVDYATWQRQPWQTQPTCTYEEFSADVEDNQLIAWTLRMLLRSGLCPPQTTVLLEQAYRLLARLVTIQPLPATACLHRHYHRLNQAYEPLHALCYFFLSHTGPGHQAGTQRMLPFLVEMARLYERFVAAWLQQHLPQPWRLQRQARYPLGAAGSLHFAVDLVISDRATERVHWVLDTKYKAITALPDTADVAQVIAYAQAIGAPVAVLIYPTPLPHPLDVQVGGVRVRTLTFALDGDLEAAGQHFLDALWQG
jgi:5-methylcytosine-specific restriction enzyme subunit McrC